MSQPSTSVEHPSIKSSSSIGAASGHTSSVFDTVAPENTSTTRPESFGERNRISSVLGQSDPNFRRDKRHSSPGYVSQTTLSSSSSRPFGVHSILNPQAEIGQFSGTRNPNRDGGLPNTTSTFIPSLASSPQSRKRGDPASPTHEPDVPHLTRTRRRVLTPKSPRLGNVSPNVRRNPSFHATDSRFQPQSASEARIYTLEPGSSRGAEIPPLPSLVNTTQASLPQFPPGTRQGDELGLSQQTYQIGQTSGDFRFASAAPVPQPQQRTYPGLSAGLASRHSHESQAHGPHEGYQAGPASYQMTLDTDRGPMVVPVELDLQQASKVADEKRKRNAGASARFRARRKEKEKEASQTISGLQREMRDLIEEREFYRNERNFFREIAARHGQIPPRPLSPQPHRTIVPAGSTSDGSSTVTERYRDLPELTGGSRRRLTGDYQSSHAGKTAMSPPLPSYSPPSTTYGTPFQSQPPISLPPPTPTSGPYPSPRSLHPRPHQTQQQPPPPPPPPPPPSVSRSQSYDPFRRDIFDRSWNPGP